MCTPASQVWEFWLPLFSPKPTSVSLSIIWWSWLDSLNPSSWKVVSCIIWPKEIPRGWCQGQRYSHLTSPTGIEISCQLVGQMKIWKSVGVNLGMWVMVLFSWFPQSLAVSLDPEAGDQNPHLDSFLFCFPSPLSSRTPNSAPDTLPTSHVPKASAPLHLWAVADVVTLLPAGTLFSTKTSLLLKGPTQVSPCLEGSPTFPSPFWISSWHVTCVLHQGFASVVLLAWNSFPFTWPAPHLFPVCFTHFSPERLSAPTRKEALWGQGFVSASLTAPAPMPRKVPGKAQFVEWINFVFCFTCLAMAGDSHKPGQCVESRTRFRIRSS